jgi:translation initiation factor 3 subunit L
VRLRLAIQKQKIFEMQSMYEDDLATLTERYFKASTWPSSKIVTTLVGEDNDQETSAFILLYRELYYRHIFQKLSPSLEDRIAAFNNYVALFDVLLKQQVGADEFCDLPSVWLWDLTDEFIYQFQAFQAYRAQPKSLTGEELNILKVNKHVCSTQTVLKYLHALVKNADIDINSGAAQQFNFDDDNDEDEEAQAARTHPMCAALGQFALIGLARVNVLLGDYTTALRSLNNVDLRDKYSPYRRVIAAQSALFYYMSFSFLMLGRHVDAAKTLSNFLTFVSRTSTRASYSAQAVARRADKMTAMLAIVVAFVPHLIDDQLMNTVKEKFADKLPRLHRFEPKAFEDLFLQSCPRFVDPCPPALDGDATPLRDAAQQQQLAAFLRTIRQRASLPDVYSYLRLCTSISMQKLAEFVNADVATVTGYLMCLKHHSRSRTWKGGAPLSGEWQSAQEVAFYINRDDVHLSTSKATKKYSSYFMRQTLKLEDLIDDLKVRKAR